MRWDGLLGSEDLELVARFDHDTGLADEAVCSENRLQIELEVPRQELVCSAPLREPKVVTLGC
jgi:hypothetical protein